MKRVDHQLPWNFDPNRAEIANLVDVTNLNAFDQNPQKKHFAVALFVLV